MFLISTLDFIIGVILTIALLYLFYYIDKRWVYKGESPGFIKHLTETGFFPKRIVAYLSVIALALAFGSAMKHDIPRGSLTFIIVDFIYRIFAIPFAALLIVCAVAVAKIIFFPRPDDPDHPANRKKRKMAE